MLLYLFEMYGKLELAMSTENSMFIQVNTFEIKFWPR